MVVAEDIAWTAGYSGWAAPDATEEELTAALAIIEVEVELREREWAALELLLSHACDDKLAWPDDPAEIAPCLRAAERLGWLGTKGASE